MHKSYQSTGIGFTAQLAGAVPSSLYAGGQSLTQSHGKTGRAMGIAEPEGAFVPGPMDQFEVWAERGRRVLMVREPRADGCAFFDAVRVL